MFLFWIDPKVSESEDNLSFRFESGPPQLFVRDAPLLDQFRSISNFASVVPRYVEQKHSLAETSILKDVDPLLVLPTVLVLLLVDLGVVETVVISFVSERFGTKLKFQRLVCSVIGLHLAFGHLKQQETQTVWLASIFTDVLQIFLHVPVAVLAVAFAILICLLVMGRVKFLRVSMVKVPFSVH